MKERYHGGNFSHLTMGHRGKGNIEREMGITIISGIES